MKAYLSLIIASFLLALASCAPAPELILETDSLVFSADGGTQTVRVSSNETWRTRHTESYMDFFTINPSGGNGDGIITISINSNPFTRGRLGIIEFACGSGGEEIVKTMRIIQNRAEPYASFMNWSEVTVPSDGGTINTAISYNTPWTLSCNDTGIVFNPSTDMDGYYFEVGTIPVTITIPENHTAEDKTYDIILQRFHEAQEYSSVTYRFFQTGKKQ